MTKKWRVAAYIPFPLEPSAKEECSDSANEDREWKTRWRPTTIHFDDLEISLHESQLTFADLHLPAVSCGFFVELVELRITLDEESSQAALSKVRGPLEHMCDDLAFRAQIPIPIVALDVIDVTEPMVSGEERECLSFPPPVGYRHTKFHASMYIDKPATELVLELRPPSIANANIHSALRWYHKGLAAAYEIDRFVFLWISLEILWKKSDFKDKKVFINSCQHEISHCLVCDEPTDRLANGQALMRFLVEYLHLSEEQAKRLWRYRQVVHGANDLTDTKNEEQSEYVIWLRAAVALALKRSLGLHDLDPPLLAPEGVAVANVGFTMSRIVA